MFASPLVFAATSNDNGFSVPILVAAAALTIGWVLLVAIVVVLRRAPDVDRGPESQELPAESPAVAGMLCDDFELPAELVPATLLDLAARRIVQLEEVQPGKTICRMRRQAEDSATELTPYERRVLQAVRGKAIDGVVPAEALTTGTEDASRSWMRAFHKAVVDESQANGLTRDRWPAHLVGMLGVGPLAIGGLLWLSSAVGGDAEDHVALAATAASIAVVGAFGIVAFVGRLSRSLAQLPTEQGSSAAARDLGLQAHLRADRQLTEAAPASVVLWGRHLAYAGAMGIARTAVQQLPMGAEDDRRAWSRFGGQWRRVRVRYPRARPPAWGKHPLFAVALALLWGTVAGVVLYGLLQVAQEAANSDAGLGPSITREQLDWIGRSALILVAPCALVLLWSAFVLVRAVPDLWRRRSATGELVRARRHQQLFKAGSDPKYWYYLALDDGTKPRIPAWRVPADLYRQHHQGETVTAVFTPNLGYIHELRAGPTPAP